MDSIFAVKLILMVRGFWDWVVVSLSIG